MTKKKGTAYEELVAIIVREFFNESCTIKHGSWIDGPDGRRDMDVLVEGVKDGKKEKILIECKDYDKSKTGRVGIELIDALDSKRRDLSIDKCLICSNSGFTAPALRKAKRTGIGPISVLKSGDDRIKIEIIEKIFYRVINVDTFTCTFHFHRLSECIDPSIVLYKKLPVYLWVQQRMSILFTICTSKEAHGQLNKTFRFKHPLQVKSNGRKHYLSSVEGTMEVSRCWYSIDVKLDARSAIYNYLSGQLMLSPGENNLQIHGLDIVGKAGNLEHEPPEDSDLGVTFNNNKNRVAMTMVEGINYKSEDEIPKLNSFVVDEDLSLDIKICP